ncbi:MAG: deacylase [Rhodospirillaceae bacterium]|nr:deacylase [Rhodospirillaceae bacterium]
MINRPFPTIHQSYKLVFKVTFLFFVLFGVNAALGDEPGLLTVGVGGYDLFDDETTGEFRSEYVFPDDKKIGIFAPFVGLSGTTESASYLYGGIGLDLFFGNKFVVTPNFAAGIYGNGDGKDLGHAIEFRSGINFAYRLPDYSRVGLTFHHISNAGLDERNPGEESLLILYSVPIDRLLGR